MAGREDTFNKKTIIAIVTIIVLLLVASISVGVFLADKGKTEAAESSQTAEKIDNDKKEDNGNSEDQSVQNSNNQVRESQEQNTDGNNEQTQNSDNQTANDENNNTTNNTANNTSNSVATSNNQTTRNNITNNKTNNNTTSTSSTQTPASTGKSNNGATTGTNINEVGETTITRVEEGEEKVVAKKFWDWWNPMSVVVASTTANINAEKPNISVEKSATTKAGENLVYAGEQIKYTINVTNNGKKDVENIEVTDKIPANTTFASINNDGETITSENNIVGVKWIVSVPAGETVTVEFTVTVNPTMLDENGETVETKGIINNKAIANGEESNEVKTAIIKSQKTSAILRDMEQVEKAKIGDTIIYYISVENTGDISGKTTITDYVPAGTELLETPREASVTTDEKGTKIEWKDIDVQANGTKTVFFMVRVTDIDGIIRNVATVGGKDTNEEDVGTADIEITKNVTDIKRDGKSIGKDAKVQAGDVIEYELIVTNKGSEKLTNVVVTDELAGIELTDGSWNVGDLASKESKTIKATYTVQYEKDINGNAEKTITNYAVVTGTSVPVIPEETPEEVSDDDDVTTPVEDTPKLEVDKLSTAVNGNPIAEGKTKVRAGDVIEYTIIVKNTGNIKLTNVVITENNTVKVGNETFTVNEETGNVVIKTIPSLAVGETAEAIKAYYTVTEDDVKEAGTIYNLATAKPEETTPVEDDDDNVVVNEDTSVTAKKIWEDNNNQDGIRPDTIELTLYADGTEYKDEKTNQTVKVTVIPEQKADNEWSYTFEKLPTYNKDGAKITYTIVETSIGDKYTTTYSEDGLTVTNSHTPATTSITVNKYWDDNDDQDGIRPENVTLILKANGTEVGRATVGESENWSKTFDNLPVNANGEEIEYTVDEETVTEGYGKTVDGMTVTNSHTPATTSITVNKYWDDNDDQDGIRPENVTLILKANGTEVGRATVGENENWSKTFDNLPVNANGEEIEYTVDEETVTEGYGKTVDGMTVTNSHTPATTSITVNKYWDDNDDQDGIRPENVTLILKANGTEVGRATVGESENWSKTFDNLPVNANGEEIEYTVDEETVTEGYGKTVNGMTVTNSHTPATTSITVNKYWDDNDDQDGIRPESVTLILKANGTEVGRATVGENENWSKTFDNLPVNANGEEIEYTVDEETVTEGYGKTVDGMTVTNSHTPATTSITVNKYWDDNDDQDGIRPENVTLILKANGTEVGRATVGENENWSKTFDNLPVNANGEEIEYTVDEETVTEGYGKTVDGMTVTNSHTPATTSITVNKYWDDNDDQDGIRPENVTLILKANGTEVGRATVGENENWSKTFDNLPVNANGEEIEYTVDEETVTEGYGKTVDGMTVTNSHTPATTSITVNKYWDDNDDQDGKRPESITVKLLANGEQAKDADGNDLVATITPDANGNWTYTWSELDKYKAGEKITYTVEENAVENYNTPSEPITLEEAENGYIGTITNTHEIEKTSVTVNKDWQDKDNQDGKRPESITVKLLADGEQAKDADGNDLVATITPDANGNWIYTWSGLDKYKAGEKITYTVEENAVENYNTPSEPITLKEAENGYIGTITNTHEIEKTSVTVNKDWQDGSNQDGIRPDSVSITLNVTVENSDGEEESITLPSTVESTITLNEGNSWTYTWSGLDKYKNGQEIKYTVAENNVDERYTVSIKSNNQTTANGYAYTVTNSYTPATIDIPVTKVWNDNDYTEARKTITVELWADGSKTGKTIDIKSANGWKGTFKGLPRYKAGEEITYTIKEKAVDRYVTESITGDSTNGFTITNKYQNVIVNKNVVKSVMNEEKFKSKLDFVFVLDTSSSMQGEKAKTMINALNSTMATILENENNRVGVVGYSDDWYEEKGDNATTLLELDHYTANSDNEFIKLAGSGDYTYIQANAINSQGNSENAYRYVRGATYTQIGIRDGANLLINESDREGRIPVIILLTDGDPTRYTTEYNNVKQYNRGDGKANSITAAGAYYTIMSARHYKNAVNDKYKTTENPNIAKFFTIGIDMDKDDIYENTLLNPNKDNVESCKDSDSRSKTRGIYNLMKDNYYKNGGKGSFTGENLNFYSYSDGAFIGNMNEEKLKNILKKTMESIYTYEKETTRTTNIDVDTAVIELEHLDAEKKIEIKINGETTEYTVQELIDSKVVTQTGSKYYMDLNADMFKNKQTIEITYYQVSLLNK